MWLAFGAFWSGHGIGGPFGPDWELGDPDSADAFELGVVAALAARVAHIRGGGPGTSQNQSQAS